MKSVDPKDQSVGQEKDQTQDDKPQTPPKQPTQLPLPFPDTSGQLSLF